MSPPSAAAPLSLVEARLVQGVRRADPGALQEVWDTWKHAAWSVCRAMAPDAEAARLLLVAVYREFPRQARTFTTEHPLCCQVGALVHLVLAAELDLPELSEVQPEPPVQPRAPEGDELARRLAALPPELRLVYLLDLFFHCPSAETSSLTGISETALRHARSRVAWALVTERGR